MADKITFNGSDYPLNRNITCASNIDVILTAINNVTRKDQFLIIDTDAENLTSLEEIKDSSLNWINDSIQTIGLLVASANPDMISHAQLREAGFVLVGLGEIQRKIQDYDFVFDETRQYLKASDIKKPA